MAKQQDGGGRIAPSHIPGVYDALMFVSLGFLILGILFLFLELNKYGFQISGN